jgi:uncharacterized RDD family membrane protein YckC
MAQWYYARGNQQFGPVSIDQLLGLLGTGQVQHADLVWTEGMPEWAPASTVAALSPRPAPAPIVNAPPPPAAPSPFPSNPYVNPPMQNSPMPGQPIGGGYASGPVMNAPPWPTQPGMLNYGTGPAYAGFWLRFAAYIIDYIITYVGGLIIGFFIGLLVGIGGNGGARELAQILGGIAGFILGWLYYALMESSIRQATVGKMILGLKVTDINGERIGFGQATGRFFGKIISALILCIGFMMAGWTERRQALHDIMASTLVVKKNA